MAGMKIHTFGWYLPGKMVIFHCYVSFQMILVSTLISSSDALVGHRPRCFPNACDMSRNVGTVCRIVNQPLGLGVGKKRSF